MNAFNLIDGLDGLCAGVAFLAAGTLFVAARIQGNFALEHATLPLAGALLGFLFYNFPPATMFLGDSGAMLIGLLLGCFGIVWTGQQATLVSAAAPLLALSLPLIDLSVSVVRRFLRSRPIFSPDREHIHHRLLDLGLTRWRAVLILYVAAAVGGVFALLLIHPSLRKAQAYVIVGFCAAAWVGVERLRYNEFDVAGRLLFRGEFQRALKENVRIHELAAAFERCETEEAWWDRVATAVHGAGWTSATWIRNGSIHRERAYPSQPPAWRFRIALGEDEAVEIEGPLQPAGSSLDLMALAGAIHSSLAVRRSSWERRALP
jgi:UDP-GlcNAc:undecaprenyl-phosphate/decaprenyl-phosphate GlcNAc-1-phosphate transferase